jgi:hypothetical protein
MVYIDAPVHYVTLASPQFFSYQSYDVVEVKIRSKK